MPIGGSSIPESTRESIIELRENGIRTFVATGKSLAALSKLKITDMPFDGFLTLNGQLCYDANLKMFFGYPIASEEMEVVEQMFNAEKIPFILIGEFSKYINFYNERILKMFEETHDTVPDIGKYRNEKIYQITASMDERKQEVLGNTMDYLDLAASTKDCVDIFAVGGGKMNAIKKVLEVYGVSQEETMAFGDGNNDIGMLQFANIGIAMGNAMPDCKKAADYVTDDCDKDGIYKALKHFELI